MRKLATGFILAIAALATPQLASADPCLSGTIAQVLSQGTCTISDLTFDFTGFIGKNAYQFMANSGATFTPLAGGDPGFELAGFQVTNSYIADAGNQSYGSASLSFSVMSSRGLAASSLAATPSLRTFAGSEPDGSASVTLQVGGVGLPSIFASQSVTQGSTPVTSLDVIDDPADELGAHSLVTSLDVSGAANIGGECCGVPGPVAVGDFESIELRFAEVPEPGSDLLLCTILTLLIGLSRRSRRRVHSNR